MSRAGAAKRPASVNQAVRVCQRGAERGRGNEMGKSGGRCGLAASEFIPRAGKTILGTVGIQGGCGRLRGRFRFWSPLHRSIAVAVNERGGLPERSEKTWKRVKGGPWGRAGAEGPRGPSGAGSTQQRGREEGGPGGLGHRSRVGGWGMAQRHRTGEGPGPAGDLPGSTWGWWRGGHFFTSRAMKGNDEISWLLR